MKPVDGQQVVIGKFYLCIKMLGDRKEALYGKFGWWELYMGTPIKISKKDIYLKGIVYEICDEGGAYTQKIISKTDVPATQSWDCIPKEKLTNWFEMTEEEAMNHVILENI